MFETLVHQMSHDAGQRVAHLLDQTHCDVIVARRISHV